MATIKYAFRPKKESNRLLKKIKYELLALEKLEVLYLRK